MACEPDDNLRGEWRSLCDQCGNSLLVWFLIVALAVVWLGSVAHGAAP